MPTHNALGTGADERSSLLPKLVKATPLPWSQLSVLLFARLVEPLLLRVIFPFTPQLIRETGITHDDESQVGYYVGLLQSSFFLAQACVILFYSRTSDRIGRKPVMLLGLLGASLTMLAFGLSKTYSGLLLSRILSGLLDGNVGIVKATMVDITDTTNISKAYACMAVTYGIGSTLGPVIGGSLSHPADRFSQIFGDSEFLKEYPYFFPCTVAAIIALACWLNAFFVFKETVASRTRLSRVFGFRKSISAIDSGERVSAIVSEIPVAPKVEGHLPLRSLLTFRVCVSAGNYAITSLIEICYLAVQILFFATPIELGGLGRTPPTIGAILSCYSAVDIIAQACFHKVHSWLGSKNTYILGVLGCFPLIAAFPLMNYIAKTSGDAEGLAWGIWVLIGMQILLNAGINYSHGAIFIFISRAPPNRASVGAVNGLSQMTVSFMRAVGPAAISSLFSFSIQYRYLGGYLVYVVLLGMTGLATVGALMLPNKVWTD